MFLWWEYFFSMLISSLISSSSSYKEQEKKKKKKKNTSEWTANNFTNPSFIWVCLLELEGNIAPLMSGVSPSVREILEVRFLLFMPAHIKFVVSSDKFRFQTGSNYMYFAPRLTLATFNSPAQTSRRVLATTRRSASRWMCALFRSNATDCFHSRWDVLWLHV